MRTFVLRARKSTIHAENVFSQVGSHAHVEIIAHVLANAFYTSNAMREDVDVYLVFDSTPDFPRTLHFTAANALSFPGFHEEAVLRVVANALAKGKSVMKGQSLAIAPGITCYGFGFDTLMNQFHNQQKPLFLLDKKGDDIRSTPFTTDGVFVLSDHLPMPKNSIKGLERRGARKISVSPKMLFASQCVVLLHNELDRQLR